MSEKRKFVYPPTGVTHKGPVIDSANGYEIIECEQCGFKHVVPIPTPEELNVLYRDKYYLDEKPDYFKEVEEDLEWWKATCVNYYKIFERLLKDDARSLLEIGSGPGYFLKCGQERGWKVLGFEPSTLACDYSKRLGVSAVNEPFDKGQVGKHGKFDVVYMNMVLEHLPDPLGTLKCATEVLKPEGLLCIMSPNDYNPLQDILRRNLDFKPYWLAPPQHLNYFDFKSIEKAIKRFGFRIVESLGTFPMEFFLLGGKNYVGDNKVGRSCHFMRKEFEQNLYKYSPEQLTDFFRFLASKEFGREFVVIAKRGSVPKNPH